MPIFTKKFELKPNPDRSQRCNIGCPPITEDLDDYKNISVNLSSKELKFIDGVWINCNKKMDIDDLTKLNKKYKQIEEENNLNQIKVEVLLDLLTENIYEMNAIKSNK